MSTAGWQRDQLDAENERNTRIAEAIAKRCGWESLEEMRAAVVARHGHLGTAPAWSDRGGRT